jgi:prophage regulatory protein
MSWRDGIFRRRDGIARQFLPLLEWNRIWIRSSTVGRAIMPESSRVAGAVLRRKQVEREVGLSRSTIYQRIKDGTFPKPIQLGARAVGWRASDIEQFLVDPAGYRAPSGTTRGENGDE